MNCSLTNIPGGPKKRSELYVYISEKLQHLGFRTLDVLMPQHICTIMVNLVAITTLGCKFLYFK